MTKCSVCSSETFTHRAHIKQRASFKENENDLLFNILPICARCHLIFDSPNHGFTINQEWGCWVFSDIRQFESEYSKQRFENPFYKFYYAFPPSVHRKSFSRIKKANILHNQEHEFRNKSGFSAEYFFNRIKMILIRKGRWNHEKNIPKERIIKEEINFIDID